VYCTSDLPLPDRDEEGLWLSVPVSGVSPAHGCCWGQRLVCVTSLVHVLCVRDTHSALLVVEPANRKEAAASMGLGWRSQGLGANVVEIMHSQMDLYE